jgi:uncharacterized hydrophobic protein (TIGR00271 family)
MDSIFSEIKARFRKLPHTEKALLQKSITHSASPGIGFYIFVVLSGTIATLGLLINSSPVIIGAMLLAPLMSPIIGIGLSTVIGDWQLLKASMIALLRGMMLAVTLSAVITLVNSFLPFVSLSNLAPEIMARTLPTPIDLVIALAGGLGGAYALSRKDMSAALPGVAIATALMPPLSVMGIGLALARMDVALGATLLFVTNAAAIASGSGLVFFLIGFSPVPKSGRRHKENGSIPASIVITILMIIALILPLTFFALSSVQQTSMQNQIKALVTEQLENFDGVEILTSDIYEEESTYFVDVTVRTTQPLPTGLVDSIDQQLKMNFDKPIKVMIYQIMVIPLHSE